VAFENMAADFEQRTRLKVNLEDDDALLRDPAGTGFSRIEPSPWCRGWRRPHAAARERGRTGRRRVLALQVAKATAQENKAREAFEKQAADFEQRFGIRVI
jgi:hypothetical protein